MSDSNVPQPPPIPMRSRTARGFAIYDEFVDLYGSEVRVQESSLAGTDAVWIFAQSEREEHDTPHLDIDMAKRVRDALDVFIKESESDG